MNKVGQANTTEREIFYISTQKDNWVEQLPSEKWLVIPITDKKDNDLIDKVSHVCLNNNVTYICAIGQVCEYVHDWFDETILLKRIEQGQSIKTPDDFEDEPMTTWHNDFNEGFWFAVTAAYDGDKKINKVVCLDMTDKGYNERIIELLSKINQGWLPDN